MPTTNVGNSRSALHSAVAKRSVTLLVPRAAVTYLRMSLPAGWESYWRARKCGRYWGITIMCPRCEMKPPKEIKPWNRWRWLAAHEVGCKG